MGLKEAEAVGGTGFAGTARFQIVRTLGAGGMGVVYEALDTTEGTRVALKTLKTASPELLLRLKREFRSLHDIVSPNLVRYGDLVSADGTWFFTMELIEGTDFLRYVWPASAWEGVPLTHTDSATRDALAEAPTAASDEEVPAAARFDEGRLRAALQQLARGLATLHKAGKVHRDVKPSNVLVTRDGRVVLVDLGLVLESNALVRSIVQGLQGTVEYMAPEQGAGANIGPPSDWYAVGVMLYQALVGQLPFRGLPLQVLDDKRRKLPPPPCALVSSLPSDLDSLCMALLRTDPAARPTDTEILSLLDGDSGRVRTGVVSVVSPNETPAPFVGRAAELASLHDAFEESRRGKPVTITVRGESGIGKSALVRTFTERLLAHQPGVIVLAGRCFERESIPYKALDSIIDALATYLQGLRPVEAATLVPRRASALLQVFPVLGRVSALRNAPKVEIADSRELRSRAFEALRELFAKLCERHPVVIVIDDFHWADRDSLMLLGELVRPPDAPPFLGIATWRTGSAVEERRVVTPQGVSAPEIELGRLDRDEATELAATLLTNSPRDLAAQVACNAAGHPLFIGELARAGTGARSAGKVSLDGALWDRVEHLDRGARKLVELLSTAEAPLRREVLARASGLDRSVIEAALAELQASRLARAAAERGSGFMDVYHARVREAVRTNLAAEDRASCHAALALAFEATDPEAYEALAVHHAGAGDEQESARFAALAGDKAAEAVAFDQAARLYRRALELGHRSEVRALQRKLADALANAGRGREASEAYLAASETADPREALDLRRRAGEQLIRSGHVDEAIVQIKKVLTAIGLSYPESRGSAIATILLRRAQLRLRGIRFRPRDPASVTNTERERAEILQVVAEGLGAVDPLRGTAFQSLSLLFALRAGDPGLLLRALGAEAFYRSNLGTRGSASTARATAQARRLLPLAQTAMNEAFLVVVEGLVAYQEGRYREALACAERGEAILLERCIGASWWLWACRLVRTWSLAYLGQIPGLRAQLLEHVPEAERRRELLSLATLPLGVSSFSWLADDDPSAARAQVASVMAAWPRRGMDMMAYLALYSECQIDLYQRRPRATLDRLTQAWPDLKASFMLGVQSNRIELLDCRARAALMCVKQEHERASVHRRHAASDARRLEREDAAWANGFALRIRAGLAFADGNRDHCLRLLDRADEAFGAAHMELHSASVRYVAGQLRSAAEGSAQVNAAEARIREQTVRNPDRMAKCLVPGILV